MQRRTAIRYHRPNDAPPGVREGVTAHIALGSNLGQRQRNLTGALERLESDERVEVVRVSSVVESEPVGGPPGQDNYYNAVAEVRTTLSPPALLELCRSIESALGRQRTERWGPRTIDLDILLYGDQVISTDTLQVPHPLMHERLFVMQPLAEIAPDVMHPLLNMTARTIYESLVNG